MGETKRNFRLIALDMDGTLLDANQNISEENRRAIEEARAKGVEVILSTGRHYITCNEYAKSLGLSSYLITVNGSEIWTADGKLVERQLIDAEIIRILVELQKKHKTNGWMSSTNQVYRGEIPDELGEHEWLKFGFEADDPKALSAIYDELSTNEKVELSNSSTRNIEVNAAGVNKARALEKVCGELGIVMDEVIAMGDSLNDIKMIEVAGLGIAMGNAQEEVKEAANWVTGTNIENGVAQAIRRWVL